MTKTVCGASRRFEPGDSQPWSSALSTETAHPTPHLRVRFAAQQQHRSVTQPLLERKKRLPGVIGEAVPAGQLAESFDDGAALLAACTKIGLRAGLCASA